MRTESWMRATGAVGLLQVVQVGLLFLVQVLFARLLGAEGFGVYAFAIATATYLLPVAVLGLDLLALRDLPRANSLAARIPGRFIGSAVGVILLTGVALGGIAWLVLPTAGAVEAVALLAALPLLATGRFLEAASRASGGLMSAFAPRAILRPLVLLTGIGAALSAGVALTPIDGVRLQAGAAALVAVVLGLIVSRRVGGKGRGAPTRRPVGGWIRRGRGMAPIPVLRTLLGQTDIIVVGVLLPARDVGIYVAARQLALFAGFGLTAWNSVVGPAIGPAAANGTLPELAVRLRSGTRRVAGAALLLLVVYGVAGEWILAIFGSEFTAGWTILLILTAAQVVNTGVGPVALVLSLTRAQRYVVRAFAVGAVVTAVLLAVLVPLAGAAGAAGAVLASTVLWNMLLLRDLSRLHDISTSALG